MSDILQERLPDRISEYMSEKCQYIRRLERARMRVGYTARTTEYMSEKCQIQCQIDFSYICRLERATMRVGYTVRKTGLMLIKGSTGSTGPSPYGPLRALTTSSTGSTGSTGPRALTQREGPDPPADKGTALLLHDQLPVGWGYSVHVPVRTQAQQPHLSCCPAGTALLFHDQLPVGWGGVITFMFLCTHKQDVPARS